MDIAVKKIELIEWLVRLQDKSLILKIEALKMGSIKDIYEQRIPETMQDLQAKLDRSEQDIKTGRVHSQKDVEAYFKSQFGK